MSYQDSLATANTTEIDLPNSVTEVSFSGKPVTSLSFERIIRQKAKHVFRHLSESDCLRGWFATVMEGELRQDSNVTFRWDDNRIIQVKILQFRKNKCISAAWTDERGDQSVLDISLRTLKAHGSFTTIKLEHHLLRSNMPHDWTKRYLNRWIFHLDNLCSVVECGEDLRPTKSHETGWEWLTSTG